MYDSKYRRYRELLNFWLVHKHGCFVSPCVLWPFFYFLLKQDFKKSQWGEKVYIITKSPLKCVRHPLLTHSNVLPPLPNIRLAHNAENQPPARQQSGLPGVYPGDMQTELHNGSCFIHFFIIKLPNLMYSGHLFNSLSVSRNTLCVSIITSIKIIFHATTRSDSINEAPEENKITDEGDFPDKLVLIKSREPFTITSANTHRLTLD